MKGIFILLFINTLIVLGLLFLMNSLKPPSVEPKSSGMITLFTPSPYSSEKRNTREAPYTIEEYARGLSVPWSLVFTGPNRLLVAQRDGKIRFIEGGSVSPFALFTFDEVEEKGEEGLMGMTLDPEYISNKTLYACLAYPASGEFSYNLKVEKLIDEGSGMTRGGVVIDKIPAAEFHAGCRIKFGPDGKLYITTGDAAKPKLSQDLNSLAGKTLRINKDGTVPPDNPFQGSPIWSYGHRNAQGLDWYPMSNVLYESEHGPSGGDGPPGGDEVNVIEAGENYGWPLVSHQKTKEGTVSPSLVFTPAFAPASGMFYKGKMFPQFYGNFFMGGLKGEGIMRIVVEPKSPSKILSYGNFPSVDFGRIRDIVEGPDGAIYFSTSNTDGRGKPNEGDDKIYRITEVR